MMDYSNSADRWMARPHPGVMDDSASDLARHPLFGNGPTSGHLFADVTTTAHSAFNVGDFDACRRTTSYMEDDDGDDESVLPAPPSRAYTEAASSQSQQTQSTQMASQESTDSMNPARLRTDEVIGFWAHRVAPRPLLNPPTPQAQRTGFLRPEESPMSVVDGVVRAGLDTPSRYEAGTTPQRTRAPAPPQYGGASYGAQSGGASDGNSSTSSNFVSVASDQSPSASPHNSGAAMTQGRLVSAGGQQYRTVQQYRSEQQLREQGGVRGSTAATQASRPQPHPRFDGVMSASGPIVIIEFKMDRRRRFRCAPELAPTILPDMWVVVQLENGGVDMGACVEVFNANDRHSIPKHYGHGEAGHVVRLADEDDCRVLNEVIPAKEEAALAKAHQLVHFLHMPFTCIDAEFQFDLKVVNLYYTLTPQAFTSIIPNVSRLQRELGFTLKAKVHLEQLVPVDQA